MDSQKQKIIKIINQEINHFAGDMDKYIKNNDFLRAAITAKVLNTLRRMIQRIQTEV